MVVFLDSLSRFLLKIERKKVYDAFSVLFGPVGFLVLFQQIQEVVRIVPILVVETCVVALRMPVCGRIGLERHLSVSIRSGEAMCWNHTTRGMGAHAADSFSLREFATRTDKE